MMIITMRVDFDASWRAGYGTCMRMMTIWCWRWRRCPRGETRSDTLVKVAPPGPRQWAIVPTWDAVSCVSAKILHDKPKTGHLNSTIKSPSSHMLLLISEHFILEAYYLCPIVLQKSHLFLNFARYINWNIENCLSAQEMDQQHIWWRCWCFSCIALNFFFGILVGSQKIAP